MNSAFSQACCARLPAVALSRLGGLRAREDLRAVVEGEVLWVFWPAPDAELTAWMLSLPGAELLHGGPREWRGLHRSLPIFDVPDPNTGKSLSAILFPAPVDPLTPGPAAWRPAELRLVRDDLPRPTTALLLPLSVLAGWAESATSHALEGLIAAGCGDLVLLRGRLPALHAERYWGKRILAPAGWRPEPLLPESTLAQALHLAEDDIALLTHDGAEVLPPDAFGDLTRAAIRLATEAAGHAR